MDLAIKQKCEVCLCEPFIPTNPAFLLIQRQEAELRELQMKLVNSENEKRLAEEAHQHALERERLLQQEKEKQANMLLMNQSANNPFNSMSMVQEQPPNFRAELRVN